MKKRITIKRSLLTLIAAVLSLTASAQLREDAFIIRTTDGAAQGLLFGDVEKITFSNLDDEDVPHTGIYYQELHYPDTIIRVPVNEITEVSFEKPRVKYQPDVILGHETGLFSYLSDCNEEGEGYKLIFSSKIPEDLLPKVGQVVTYFGNDIKKLGYKQFVGRVTKVNMGSWIQVFVDKPESLRDIYKEFVGVEAIEDDSPGMQAAKRKAGILPKDAPGTRRNAAGGFSKVLTYDLPVGFRISDDDEYEEGSHLSSDRTFALYGGIKGKAMIRLSYNFDDDNDQLSLTTDLETTPYFGASLSVNGSWEKKFPDDPALETPIFKFVPPSAPMFTINLGAGLFIKLSGSAQLSLNREYPTTRTRYYSEYNKGVYTSKSRDINQDDKNKGVDNSGSTTISISLDGSLSFGAYMGLYAGTDAFKVNIGLLGELYLGPKLSGSIAVTPSIPEGSDSNVPNPAAYNLFKNSNVTFTWCSTEVSFSYYQKIMGKEKKRTFLSLTSDFNPQTLPLLPDFDVPDMKLPSRDYIANLGNNYWRYSGLEDIRAEIVDSVPEGKWFLPLKIGYALYDSNDRFIQSGFRDGVIVSGNLKDYEDPGMVDYFKKWKPEKYKLYPAYMAYSSGPDFSGFHQFRAEPYREVDLAEELYAYTGDNTVEDPSESVSYAQCKIKGAVGWPAQLMNSSDSKIGFLIGRDAELSPDNAEESNDISLLDKLNAGERCVFVDGFGSSITDPEYYTEFNAPKSTNIYYRAAFGYKDEQIVEKNEDGTFNVKYKYTWILGDVRSFKTPDKKTNN